jgi:acid phosphatase family membrane protein YuiD
MKKVLAIIIFFSLLTSLVVAQVTKVPISTTTTTQMGIDISIDADTLIMIEIIIFVAVIIVLIGFAKKQGRTSPEFIMDKRF